MSRVDFHQWKTNEEKATLSYFVKRRGATQSSRQQSTVCCYYCHRSGHFVSKDGRLRRLKMQGSCRIAAFCPAAIFTRTSATGKLNFYFAAVMF